MAIDVAWAVGALDEPPGSEGIRHLLARAIAFEAVRGRTGQLVEAAGARVYTSIEPDCMHVGVLMPASGLWRGAQALGSALAVELSAATVDSQRPRILGEIDAQASNPEDAVRALFLNRTFGPRGYGAPSVGTPEAISGLSADALTAFRRQYFVGQAVAVGVAGGITVDDATSAISRWMGEMPPVQQVGADALPHAPLPAAQSGHFVVYVPDANLEWVIVGSPVPSAADSGVHATASVAAAVLGLGMGSRLFRRLRGQEGVAYSVTALCPVQWHGSYLAVLAAVAPGNGKRATEIVEAEMKRIAWEPVSAADMRRAKGYVLATDNLAWTTPVAAAGRLSECIVAGRGVEHVGQWREQVAAVTAEQMREFAQTWFGVRVVARALSQAP